LIIALASVAVCLVTGYFSLSTKSWVLMLAFLVLTDSFFSAASLSNSLFSSIAVWALASSSAFLDASFSAFFAALASSAFLAWAAMNASSAFF